MTLMARPDSLMFPAPDASHPATPFTGRHVHFIGIGGSGMSGLAHMLLNFGAVVSGTDKTPSSVTRRLSEIGCTVRYEQVAEAVPADAEMIVHSAAIKPEHPEMAEALRRGLRTFKYAQMLGEVMKLKHGVAIAGTHGKSTTTALTSHVLLASGKDPSFVVGATCPQLGGSARSGKGEAFVVEACEFDRSFHNLHPEIGVVLNIEEDHLDYYKDIHEIVESFGVFMSQTAGVVLTNACDVHCAAAAKYASVPVETFSIDGRAADWQAVDICQSKGRIDFTVKLRGVVLGDLTIKIAGRHNVGNALVAAAIATHCHVSWDKIQAAIESFRGADRRSQLLGVFDGVTVIDDYGHHPTEVRATLQALREHYQPSRLICVFQPHQHSRTKFLLEDFGKSFRHANLAIIPDIYFARDTDADRRAVNSGMLVERINANGANGLYLPGFPEVIEYVMEHKRPGDLIVSMGAGPVWEVTDGLVRRLQQRGSH